ncbi:MAG: hypothetical protein CMJ83_08985 [Planctomycetes bacterium]|nr:hypothetical protein [Planctomycetota bacterium]
MSDGVFHPGHDDLHGQTVVIYTSGPRTFIGRWDSEVEGMIRMVGASLHDSGDNDKPRDEWVKDTKKFGVAVEHQQLMIPRAEVTGVVKLREA